jgi:fatty acid desaturase
MSVAVDQQPGAGKRATTGQVRGLAASNTDMIGHSPRLVAFNAGYLLLAWAVALGAIAVFWMHPAWYTFVLAFAVVSSRQQAMLNCEHEAVHRKFLPGRRMNDLVGTFLCAAPVGSPFGAAQARHLSHHRLLATDEDPDKNLHSGEDKATRRGLARHFISGLLGGYAGMVLMGPKAPRAAATTANARRDLLSLAIVQGALAVGITLAFDWWLYPTLWLAPLATTTALAHLIRSYVEHAITDSETGEHSNRLITIKSNWLERAFLSPYYMNYHAEHHLLPSVPAPRLRRLQQRLAGGAEVPPVLVRGSYSGAIRHVASELPDS